MMDMMRDALNNSKKEEEIPGVREDFLQQYVQERRKDDVLNERGDYRRHDKQSDMDSFAKTSLKNTIDNFRPTYERGVGVLGVEEVLNSTIDDLLEKFNQKASLNVEEKILVEMFKRAYDQVSTRGRLVNGNQRMLKNLVVLSKYFSDRFSFMVDVKND